MWLFHSVSVEDLSSKCVRRELLFYMENYNEVRIPQDKEAPMLLLSSFEKDISKDLSKEELQVIPQFKIGKYTVDFVINGSEKIAIKCIGNNSHRPYSCDEELVSQHILERAGWRFLKIRASEFYLDAKLVIEKIHKLVK
ncbi:hypothetical protein SDC9_174191 [bioreactor metagenome]|uniref:Restriction endonuclease type II-like domain-containing protein n=1 Tax=bioreactor metagenome TaxID=1076179 RepID=A0A645GKM2_9ZZZZ